MIHFNYQIFNLLHIWGLKFETIFNHSRYIERNILGIYFSHEKIGETSVRKMFYKLRTIIIMIIWQKSQILVEVSFRNILSDNFYLQLSFTRPSWFWTGVYMTDIQMNLSKYWCRFACLSSQLSSLSASYPIHLDKVVRNMISSPNGVTYYIYF